MAKQPKKQQPKMHPAAQQFLGYVGEFNRAIAPHVKSDSRKEPRADGRSASLHYNIDPGIGFNFGKVQAHGSQIHNMGAEWLGMGSFGEQYLDYGSDLLPGNSPVKKRR